MQKHHPATAIWLKFLPVCLLPHTSISYYLCISFFLLYIILCFFYLIHKHLSCSAWKQWYHCFQTEVCVQDFIIWEMPITTATVPHPHAAVFVCLFSCFISKKSRSAGTCTNVWPSEMKNRVDSMTENIILCDT